VVFTRDFIIYIDFTYVAALNTTTNDVTSQIRSHIEY